MPILTLTNHILPVLLAYNQGVAIHTGRELIIVKIYEDNKFSSPPKLQNLIRLRLKLALNLF